MCLHTPRLSLQWEIVPLKLCLTPQVSRSFGAGAQSVDSGLCIVPSTSTGYCLMTTGLRLLSKTALY